MFDFGWYRVDQGDRPHTNHKGLVTWDRKTKKDAFYFYKANWSDKPVLYITSKRHVLRTEKKTEIKVYSNCDYVALKVNGASVGRQNRSDDLHSVFKWEGIELSSGKNLIQVEGQKNGESCKDECIWKLE
jgi:beta-galactosidase